MAKRFLYGVERFWSSISGSSWYRENIRNPATGKSMRPKLLLVTTVLGSGGAERHVVRIANELVDHCEVQIAVLRPGGSYEQFLNSQVPVNGVSPEFAGKSTVVCSLTSGNRLRQLLKTYQPDCCISFLDPAASAVGAAIRSFGKKVTHIISCQNNIAVTHKNFRKSSAAILLPRIRRAYRECDLIIAISQGVENGIREYWPSLEVPIQVCHNAIGDQAELSRLMVDGASSDRLNNPTRHLVACGRLTRQKGFDLLLKAFQRVRELHDCKLTILGEGMERGRLQELAIELGIERHVSMPGFIDNPTEEFCKADVFVLSSRWEGFGNVIVEAMACGAPVVATNCPYGPSEIITNGIDGLLVENEDFQQLSNAICAVLTDGSMCVRLADAGKRRAAEFRSDLIAKRYLDIVCSLIDAR